MNYHVILSRPFDLETFKKDANAQKCPRHTMLSLADRLGAKIHQPEGLSVTLADIVRAKLTGLPIHWALARQLSSQLTSEDIVFCIGEDSGFPLAALCAANPNRPRLAVFIHNIDRFRGKLSLKVLQLAKHIDLFITNTTVKADFLREYLNLPEERVYLVTEQTDTQFFTPGASTPGKARPIIGSGGLEQRDYRTLAKATSDLDVDVRISAVSPNAKATAKKFPDVMPDNMSARHYDWCDLLQLYRDSDIVVISLQAHNYQAGFTTLYESLACRKPVVMTVNPGPIEDLVSKGLVKGVKPYDAEGMRAAILELLNHPQNAEEQAERAYQFVLKHHNSEQYVESIAEELERLGHTHQAA
jgi:glycosyltransferase involved in cell wall biosynthesis